jgi:DNA-binding transcriptional LysR family regulator
MMRDILGSISWEDFRLIKALVACGTLAGAAATVGINQSTVFRRLRSIEVALKADLFEKHRTGYVLTAAGHQMATLADRIDQDILAVVRNLTTRDQELVGELRITMSDSMFADMLAPMLRRFASKYPKLTLDVVASNEPLNLSRRDVDVAIRASDRPPENLVGRRLARIAWALYRRASDSGPDALEETATQNWVSLNGNLTALKAGRHIETHIPPGQIVCRVNSVLGAATAIETGLGIGYLPCFTGDSRRDLKRISTSLPDFAGTLWLLTHQESRHIPRVRVFLNFVANEIAKQRTLIEGRQNTR